MREIKFRAWDGKEMDESFTLECLTYIYDRGYYCEGYGFKFDIFQEGVIVMQYTGLKDKNGKEIYEGDIIFEEYNVMSFGTDLGERKETLIVKIPDFYYWLANAAGDVGDDYIGEYVSEMVVSGNIYENPNLLSQDK